VCVHSITQAGMDSGAQSHSALRVIPGRLGQKVQIALDHMPLCLNNVEGALLG
jgi:hypothetical protein